MTNKPDKFEKYLTGSMTTRRLCQLIGFDDFVKDLVQVLFGLLKAHDKIVARETKKLTLDILRAYQQGKFGKGKGITEAQISGLLGLSRKEVKALDNLRMASPSDPLDRVRELDRFTADLRLPNGKLSALLVAKVFGLQVKQMVFCLSCAATGAKISRP